MMSWKDFLKSHVLSWRRKVHSDYGKMLHKFKNVLLKRCLHSFFNSTYSTFRFRARWTCLKLVQYIVWIESTFFFILYNSLLGPQFTCISAYKARSIVIRSLILHVCSLSSSPLHRIISVLKTQAWIPYILWPLYSILQLLINLTHTSLSDSGNVTSNVIIVRFLITRRISITLFL